MRPRPARTMRMRPRMAKPLAARRLMRLIAISPSVFDPVVPRRLQALTQKARGVVLAGQQGVDAQAGARGQLLEADALELVGDEHRTLLWRQLGKRLLELRKKVRTQDFGVRVAI